jgi:hypothetical protein
MAAESHVSHLALVKKIRSTAEASSYPNSKREKLLGNARKSVPRALLLAGALAVSAAMCSSVHAQVFSADAVKAAFLHRFASYVEWPPEAVGDGPFVIAVTGAEDVARNLDELLPRMTLQGRRAEVRRITRGTDLEGVHILYIGAQVLARTRDLRDAAMQQPILLVTDGDDGFDGGGVINFLELDNKVRFEVSLMAADRARLRIDSALLAVAARVEREPQAWLSPTGAFLSPYGEPSCRREN